MYYTNEHDTDAINYSLVPVFLGSIYSWTPVQAD